MIYALLDDFVIVGSKEGHLLIYKITFRNQAKLHADIEITLSNKNFTTAIGTTATRKSVIQLDVIPEHKILIALTTGEIQFKLDKKIKYDILIRMIIFQRV